MHWKFWRKDPAGRMTPVLAAMLPIALAVDRKPPFNIPSPNEMEIDEEFREFAWTTSFGYRLVWYLLLLEMRFGSEVSKIVAACMKILADRVKKSEMEDQLALLFEIVERMRTALLDVTDARGQSVKDGWSVEFEGSKIQASDLAVEYYFALYLILRFRESPVVQEWGIQSDNSNLPQRDVVSPLATILEHAKKEAVAYFGPVIAGIQFKPESIEGLRLREDEVSR